MKILINIIFLFIKISYYKLNSECHLECPDGYYKNTDVWECQLCDDNCVTCDAGTDSDCLSCLAPKILVSR